MQDLSRKDHERSKNILDLIAGQDLRKDEGSKARLGGFDVGGIYTTTSMFSASKAV